jgi:hypothetical protein
VRWPTRLCIVMNVLSQVNGTLARTVTIVTKGDSVLMREFFVLVLFVPSAEPWPACQKGR